MCLKRQKAFFLQTVRLTFVSKGSSTHMPAGMQTALCSRDPRVQPHHLEEVYTDRGLATAIQAGLKAPGPQVRSDHSTFIAQPADKLDDSGHMAGDPRLSFGAQFGEEVPACGVGQMLAGFPELHSSDGTPEQSILPNEGFAVEPETADPQPQLVASSGGQGKRSRPPRDLQDVRQELKQYILSAGTLSSSRPSAMYCI